MITGKKKMVSLFKRLGEGIKKNAVLPLAFAGLSLLATPKELSAQDTIPPQIEITSPVNDSVYTEKPINQFTVSDDSSEIDTSNSFIRFNNDTTYNWDSINGETLNPQQGLNALQYYFVDDSSNVKDTTINFNFDNISPELTIGSPQNKNHYSTKPINNFSISDAVSVIDSTNSFIRLNISDVNTIGWENSNGDTLNPIEGKNEMDYYFTDTLGNETSVTNNFVYDTTKPNLGVTTPENGMYYSYKPTNQFTISDTYLDSTNSFIRLNGSDIDTSGWENSNGATLNPIGDVRNTIEYFFTDSAGNNSSISRNFVYDTISPNLNSLTPVNDTIYSEKPTNQFSVSDTYLDSTNSFIRFNSDTLDWKNSNGDILNPIEGLNEMEYFFTDSAGNNSSMSRNFVYDTTAPFFNVDSVQDGMHYSYRPLNNFNVFDPISGTDSTNSFIRFNNDTIHNWDSIQGNVLNPRQGRNEIEYYFSDIARNDTSITKSFVYDTIYPSLKVGSPKNDSLYLERPINQFNISDTYLDSINSCIKLNGNKIDWKQSNGDTLENLLEGTNTIEYFFTDSAGNTVTTQKNFVYRNSSNGFDKHWLINPFKQSETHVSSSYGNGDLNNDGEVTRADVDSINNLLGQNVPNPKYAINLDGQPRLEGEISRAHDRADVDGDGVITPIDKAMILKYIDEGNKSYLPGRFWTSLTNDEKQSWVRNIASIDKSDSIPENSTPGEVWNSKNYARQVEINSKGIRNLSDITQEEYSSTLSQNPESLETLRRFNLPIYSVHNTTSDEWFNGILTEDNPLDANNWFFFNPTNDSEINTNSLSNSKIEVKYNYGYNEGTGNFIDMTFLEWNIDSVGNPNLSYSASSNRFVTGNPNKDNQNPEINFNLQNNSSYNKNTLEDFIFTVSDTSSNNSNFLDTLWYKLDDYSKQNINVGVNEVFPPKKSHLDTIQVPKIEGEHQVQIYAKDIAGNHSNRTINFIYDNTAPSLKVNHPDKEGVYSTHPINDFNVSDAVSRIDPFNSYIKLNGNKIDWEQSNGDTLEGMVGDTNTIEYYFTDKAGNDSSITRNWIYDNTKPTISINKPQGETVNDNDLAWEIIEENLDTAWYTVNGKSWGINNLVDTTGAGYQQGENSIEIYARDKAGNDTSISKTVYSDTTYESIDKSSFEDYSVKAYPNPTDGDFNIKYNFEKPQDGSINIYNLNGNSLEKGLIENDVKGTKRFNITGPSGTYIYKINTEKGYNKTGKIIKND